MPQLKRKLLILGGTKEAASLAQQAVDKFGPQLEVITSLAGRTKFPKPLPGEVHIGGFGGSQGLADYISHNSIDMLIDATHPFAAQISAHAAQACTQTNTPRLTFCRPKWQQTEADTWHRFKTFEEAAKALPKLSKRPFLTVGKQGAEHFSTNSVGCYFILRLLEEPAAPLPFKNYEVVIGKPPFSAEDEIVLFKKHQADALVTKESGGKTTEGKILAARQLGLPVIVIERPKMPDGEKVGSVEGCLAWANQCNS
ncbi:MAG: cobalt-precorrin-6A reductase [Rhodospirillales bacterium]|nr:cobalt-precorrin-6A reductase [Rhodospirillales bacterium]